MRTPSGKASISLCGENNTLNYSLSLAEQGIPVFPCRPAPDKSPLTRNGFKDATTDPKKIRKWWKRWPESAIGVPTGKRSGWWVLDQDLKPAEGIDGYLALEELERQHGKLPETYTVGTPSGGQHLYFALPEGVEITNRRGTLPKGIDVRGDGGYILVPPSRGYSVREDVPVAEASAWLIEAITEPHRAAGDHPGGEAPNITAELEGPKIPFGQRNDTLTRVAGKLHDGRSFDRLLSDLLAINTARCDPPIGDHAEDRDPNEVARIARSIYGKEPCKKAAPKLDPEMLNELCRIEELLLWGRHWVGRKLKIARSVLTALILAARNYGTLIPAGVRISLSIRDLALRSGISHRSVLAAIKTLRQELGLIRRDDYERQPEHSGAIVLLSVCASDDKPSKGNHSSIGLGVTGVGVSGYTLSAPRLRCSSSGTGKRLRGTVAGTSKVRQSLGQEEREAVIRLDKAAEEILDWLERSGGRMVLRDLAEAVGARVDNLNSRVIPKLIVAGVVTVDEDTVSLVEGWLDRLDEEREITGEFEAHERDRVRHELDRAEYRQHLERSSEGQITAAPVVEWDPELEVRPVLSHPSASSAAIRRMQQEIETKPDDRACNAKSVGAHADPDALVTQPLKTRYVSRIPLTQDSRSGIITE